MVFLQFIAYQILAYGLWLIPFVAATIFLARLPRKRFFLIALLVLPPLIYVLDVQWIQSEMSKPDWDGSPDMDIIFFIGVMFRIALFAVLLSIIFCVSRRLFRTREKHRAESTSLD